MHLCWDGQFYLEELVKQKGEPVCEHLLSHRLRPGGGERGETVSADQAATEQRQRVRGREHGGFESGVGALINHTNKISCLQHVQTICLTPNKPPDFLPCFGASPPQANLSSLKIQQLV